MLPYTLIYPTTGRLLHVTSTLAGIITSIHSYNKHISIKLEGKKNAWFDTTMNIRKADKGNQATVRSGGNSRLNSDGGEGLTRTVPGEGGNLLHDGSDWKGESKGEPFNRIYCSENSAAQPPRRLMTEDEKIALSGLLDLVTEQALDEASDALHEFNMTHGRPRRRDRIRVMLDKQKRLSRRYNALLHVRIELRKHLAPLIS